MTEALPICSNPRDGAQRKLGSVGPAMGPEVCVRGLEEGALPPGEEGEVLVRGRCVFDGYEQRAHLGSDPNSWSFTADGWLRTGDRGYLDAEGHLHLTGRFKEVINRAGEKISPLTVEHALLAACSGSGGGGNTDDGGGDDGYSAAGGAGENDDVAAGGGRGGGGAAGKSGGSKGELHGVVRGLLAFAAPHEELGEVVGVAAVLEEGCTLNLAQLRRAGRKGGLLSRQWLPEVLVLLRELPKGSTGKPARIGLAQALGLSGLSLHASMRTVDLRVPQQAEAPLDYGAGRRAEARKASSKRAAERKHQRAVAAAADTVTGAAAGAEAGAVAAPLAVAIGGGGVGSSKGR
eukprot:2695683-Prymnesium_polylepis.1